MQVLTAIKLYFIGRWMKKKFGFYPLQVSSPTTMRMPPAPKGSLIIKC